MFHSCDFVDDEDGGRFLVDFQKKAVDDALQKRLELRKREEEEELIERKKLLEEKRQTDERRKKEADEEKRELLLDVPAPNDPSEEWLVLERARYNIIVTCTIQHNCYVNGLLSKITVAK